VTLDKQDIARKLRALRERTVQNGCTEQEAYAAAALAAKLMDKYGLSMTDAEIGDETCMIGYIETGRKRCHEVQYALFGIKQFTDCICYLDNCPTGKMIVFFGLPEDVEMAKYLVGVVKAAMDTELLLYKSRCKELGEPTGRRQSHSFLLGMAGRVGTRLRKMKLDLNRDTVKTTGRDLMVIKGGVVATQWAENPISLGRSKGRYATNSDRGVYTDGQAAGSRVNLNRPIGGSRGGHLLGKD